MNYQAAVAFLLSFADYERWPGFAYAARFDLRRMEELLALLGDPHLKPKTIHIAGSKGKGSTAAMIASGLRAAGFKTGLYTSPHLHTIRERIRVNGELIAEDELASLVSELKPAVEEINRGSYGELTTFELLTALAFLYFQKSGVDFQVLEAGLGGRLDATNVVNPQICVLTSISLDHTAVLGNTIAQIAAEKAGIIKPGVKVVSSPQSPEAAEVIHDACLEKKAELIMVGREIHWEGKEVSLGCQLLEVTGRRDAYELSIPLLGEHQLENAATAVAVLESLNIGKEEIISGLASVKWPGRLEILSRRPLLVVDGAHNRDSARRLKEALKKLFRFNRAILIIGTSSDKDISGIAAELGSFFEMVIATSSRHPRAASPVELAREFDRYKVPVQVTENVEQAVSKALAISGEQDLICATGSLFLVAEVRGLIKGIPTERYPVETERPLPGKAMRGFAS